MPSSDDEVSSTSLPSPDHQSPSTIARRHRQTRNFIRELDTAISQPTPAEAEAIAAITQHYEQAAREKGVYLSRLHNTMSNQERQRYFCFPVHSAPLFMTITSSMVISLSWQVFLIEHHGKSAFSGRIKSFCYSSKFALCSDASRVFSVISVLATIHVARTAKSNSNSIPDGPHVIRIPRRPSKLFARIQNVSCALLGKHTVSAQHNIQS